MRKNRPPPVLRKRRWWPPSRFREIPSALAKQKLLCEKTELLPYCEKRRWWPPSRFREIPSALDRSANMEEIFADGFANMHTRLDITGEVTMKAVIRNVVRGKKDYVDLLDIEKFCNHDLNGMMEYLDYVEVGKLLSITF
ncbi:hypothetical protein LXL04_004536 [Taraxacum kok-saghyz]